MSNQALLILYPKNKNCFGSSRRGNSDSFAVLI